MNAFMENHLLIMLITLVLCIAFGWLLADFQWKHWRDKYDD